MGGPPDSLLQTLLEETEKARQTVQDLLKSAPDEIQLHRIHGMYAKQVLGIRQALLQERAVDKDQLLVDALSAVVQFLIDRKEKAAALFIGEHLEEIGKKVEETWQDSKASPALRGATKGSAKRSPRPSPRSATPRQRKRKGEDKKP